MVSFDGFSTQSSPTLLTTYDTEQDYLPFGQEVTAGTRRTGWLDREIDWETSPLDDGLRTTDLVHRRYTPHTGSFNAPDPLWTLSVDASSYHYGRHDPVNTVDPWGLNGDDPGKTSGDGVRDPQITTGPPPGVPWRYWLAEDPLLNFLMSPDEERAINNIFYMEQDGIRKSKATELHKNANPYLYYVNGDSKLNSPESNWIKPSMTYRWPIEVDQYSNVGSTDPLLAVGTSAYAIGVKSSVQTYLIERIATAAAKSEKGLSTYLGGVKVLGRATGYMGVAISAGSIIVDVANGESPDPWDVADTVIGVLGVAVPGFGGIALIYFSGRLLYEVTSGSNDPDLDEGVSGRP